MTPDLKTLIEFNYSKAMLAAFNQWEKSSAPLGYDENFSNGAAYENARLRPILDFLIADREQMRFALERITAQDNLERWVSHKMKRQIHIEAVQIGREALTASDEGLKKLLEGG